MKEKELVLKREVVFEESTEELWGSYPYLQFLTAEEFKAWKNDKLDINISTDTYTNAESKDIPIQWMKLMIEKAERAGANFIQIDYHCDHEEYDVYGSKLTLPTPEDEAKRKEKERKKKEAQIDSQIKRLQEQMDRLKRNKARL